jgi:hypothetical protein
MRAAPWLGLVAFAVPIAAMCSACITFTLGPSTSSSKDAGTSSSGGDDGGDAAPVVQGAECGPDPDTGVVLCLAISTCPDLVIDPDLFPGCGFRIHASADVIDLECACFGQICPIGIATTCDQAAALMVDQSQYTVCMQVNEGRCTSQ